MPARGTEAGALVGRTPSSGAMAPPLPDRALGAPAHGVLRRARRVLAPLVPAGTRLDLWRGPALACVVGFRFLGRACWACPCPSTATSRRSTCASTSSARSAGDVRRGVVFVREIVPRAAIALVANALYNERYRALPMRHDVRETGIPPTVSYGLEARRPLGERLCDARRPARDAPADDRGSLRHRALLGLHGAARRLDARVPRRAPAVARLARPRRAPGRRRVRALRSCLRARPRRGPDVRSSSPRARA